MRERLAAGGGGEIYRAEQHGLGRDAVVKLIETRGRDPARVEQFLREAQVASRLDHPYAAHVYAFGAEPDGLLWIAMEHVRGSSLAQVLATQPGRRMPLARFVPLLEAIAEVVDAAHERGIVHRDLKPSNIMVLARGGRRLPKLVDFGIATLAGAGAGAGSDEPAGPGAVIGSPPYMAPELWTAPGSGDPRSDVYALGVLTFEAVTGQLPFAGATLGELARQHLTGDVPALPAELPAELTPALRAALARRPEDRPATAGAFADAVRAAAGIAVSIDMLPRLDPALRRDAAWLPQPIADAIAGFEAARNPHQTRDALREIVRAVVRYLGILALAARSRTGPGPGDAPEATAMLRELGHRDLDEAEWLALTRALIAPHAGARDGYPVPELVDQIAGRRAGPSASPSSDPIAGPTDGPTDGPGGPELPAMIAGVLGPLAGCADSAIPETVLRDRLVELIPALARLIRGLAFLTDYQLVVPREDGGEVWMGPRRARRPRIAIAGEFAPGLPALVDLDGRPVLQLAPLLQVAAPAPGSPEELFVFAGGHPGRAAAGSGARLVAAPHGFERSDEALWDWFGAHLLAVDGAAPAAVEQPPYRGLEPFTEADAAMFFGRERAAEAFANQLRVQPLAAVVGPSGTGKSSFVRAGVLPRLPAGWRAVVLRPGSSPVAALLARAGPDAGTGPDAGAGCEPAALAERLRAAAGAGTLVVVVDQFEEVFTLCHDAGERARFAEVLARAARTAEDPVRVVITLRDDFLVRAAELAALGDRLALGLTLLGTPAPGDLVRVLTEPARRVGHRFDDPELASAMVRAVAGRPGALALLSFTAARLWELRDRHFHRLTRAAYEAIGGVEGALARHAEDTLLACSTDQQRLVREVFRQLITAEGTRAVIGRGELAAALGGTFAHGANDRADGLVNPVAGGANRVAKGAADGGPNAVASAAANIVIERLIAARLLVAAERDTGADQVEVVHEALVTSWPRLAEWRREDRDGARLRDQLRAAARQWDDRGRPRGLLWRGDALDDYRRWRRRWPGAVLDIDLAFARASLADDARGRRLRRGLAGAAAALVLAAAAALAALYRSSRDHAATAHDRLVQSYEEQGRRLLLDGEYLRALPYLAQAYAEGDRSTAVRFLLARAERLAGAELAVHHHAGRARAAALRPDGRSVLSVSDDGEAAIWDAATGRVIAALPGRPGGPYYGKVSRDGGFAALPSDDGVVVWDGARIRTIAAGAGRADRIAIDPGGAQIAIAGRGEISAWDAASGERRWTAALSVAATQLAWAGDRVVVLGGDRGARIASAGGVVALAARGPVDAVAVSAGGTIATVSATAIELWDPTGARRNAIDAEGAAAAALSPDGRRLAVGGQNGVIRLHDTATGARLGELVGHRGPVVCLAFSDDATRLATAGTDLALRIWDAGTRRPVTTLLGARDQYIRGDALRFDATGARLVAPTITGEVHLFATADPEIATSVDAGEEVDTGQFFDGGARFATSSAHALQTWSAATGERLRRIDLPGGLSRISPDGTRAAVALAGTTEVELRELATGELDATLHASGHVQWAEFDHAGRRVVTASDDRTIELWSLRGDRIAVLRGHDRDVMTAEFSPDDRRIVSASADGTARIWDAGSGRQLGRVSGADVMASAELDGAGRLLTGNADRIARLWSATTFTATAAFEHASQLRFAAISGDGELVAGATSDGTVSLWDVASSSLVAELHHAASAETVAFAPVGDRLLSAGADHRAILWRLDRETRSHQIVTAFVRCHAPYRLVDTRLEITAPDCRGD